MHDVEVYADPQMHGWFCHDCALEILGFLSRNAADQDAIRHQAENADDDTQEGAA